MGNGYQPKKGSFTWKDTPDEGLSVITPAPVKIELTFMESAAMNTDDFFETIKNPNAPKEFVKQLKVPAKYQKSVREIWRIRYKFPNGDVTYKYTAHLVDEIEDYEDIWEHTFYTDIITSDSRQKLYRLLDENLN